MEEADIGRAGGCDVSGHTGRAEGLAIDQGEVVDLAWLQRLKSNPWLQMRRRNRNQFFVIAGMSSCDVLYSLSDISYC